MPFPFDKASYILIHKPYLKSKLENWKFFENSEYFLSTAQTRMTLESPERYHGEIPEKIDNIYDASLSTP